MIRRLFWSLLSFKATLRLLWGAVYCGLILAEWVVPSGLSHTPPRMHRFFLTMKHEACPTNGFLGLTGLKRWWIVPTIWTLCVPLSSILLLQGPSNKPRIVVVLSKHVALHCRFLHYPYMGQSNTSKRIIRCQVNWSVPPDIPGLSSSKRKVYYVIVHFFRGRGIMPCFWPLNICRVSFPLPGIWIFLRLLVCSLPLPHPVRKHNVTDIMDECDGLRDVQKIELCAYYSNH